jgi:ATP-dependent DNA helicase RecQ
MVVLDELERAGETGRTTRELMAVVNLGMSRIDAMLKILDVEGAVRRDGTRWQRISGSEWIYDAERYAQVTALRRAEQRAMAAFGADGRCLMRALQEELDDPDARDCGRCSMCTAQRFAGAPAPALVEQAWRHLRSRPVEIEVKKMAPDPSTGAMRKIPDAVRTEPGLALARFGDGGWWPAIERSLDAGRFDGELVDALAELTAPVAPAWLTYVPSRALGDPLAAFARSVAGALGIPCLQVIARRAPRPPQREMANAVQQVANVRGAFTVACRPPAGTGLLLDDRRNSGWTPAMIGGQLRNAGADRVVPVALATVG